MVHSKDIMLCLVFFVGRWMIYKYINPLTALMFIFPTTHEYHYATFWELYFFLSGSTDFGISFWFDCACLIVFILFCRGIHHH